MDRKSIARGILGGLLVAEGAALWERSDRRRDLIQRALARAKLLNRPLLCVRPDRDTALARTFRVYEFGPHLKELLSPEQTIVMRVGDLVEQAAMVRQGIAPHVPKDSAVVFAACVLEYVEDPRVLMDEIMRLAGSTDNIFVVTLQPWSLTAALDPRARWAGLSDGHVVSLGRVTNVHRGVVGGILAGLGVLSVLPTRDDESDDSLPSDNTQTAPLRGVRGPNGTQR
jgi:hypothetical protein